MSDCTLEPGALRRDVNNLFEQQMLDFPHFGRVLGIPADGIVVFLSNGMVCIGLFTPAENNPEGCSTALISGISAEQAHHIGVQLIDAAKEIGGDRGLQ